MVICSFTEGGIVYLYNGIGKLYSTQLEFCGTVKGDSGKFTGSN